MTASLVDDLNAGLKLILAEQAADPETVFFEDNHRALKLCLILEQILSHKLASMHIFQKTTFWDFVKHLPACLPSKEIQEKIAEIEEMDKSDIGRARLFLRVALNDGALHEFLSALIWNQEILHQCYDPAALLRSEEQSNMVLLLIENLSKIKFRMFLKDPNLGKPEFWSTVRFPIMYTPPPTAQLPSTSDPTRSQIAQPPPSSQPSPVSQSPAQQPLHHHQQQQRPERNDHKQSQHTKDDAVPIWQQSPQPPRAPTAAASALTTPPSSGAAGRTSPQQHRDGRRPSHADAAEPNKASHSAPLPSSASSNVVAVQRAGQHNTEALTHQIMLDELKEAIRPLIASNEIVTSASPDVPRFFEALEAIFSYKFQDSSALQIIEFGKSILNSANVCFWSYLDRIDECLPEGAVLKSSALEEAIDVATSLGRARAFFCMCLNDNSLAGTLRSLLWNESLTEQYYLQGALLRDSEHVSIVLMLLDSITNLTFGLRLNDPEYDDPTLWERRKRAFMNARSDYLEYLQAQRDLGTGDAGGGVVATARQKKQRRKIPKVINLDNSVSDQLAVVAAKPRRPKVKKTADTSVPVGGDVEAAPQQSTSSLQQNEPTAPMALERTVGSTSPVPTTDNLVLDQYPIPAASRETNPSSPSVSPANTKPAVADLASSPNMFFMGSPLDMVSAISHHHHHHNHQNQELQPDHHHEQQHQQLSKPTVIEPAESGHKILADSPPKITVDQTQSFQVTSVPPPSKPTPVEGAPASFLEFQNFYDEVVSSSPTPSSILPSYSPAIVPTTPLPSALDLVVQPPSAQLSPPLSLPSSTPTSSGSASASPSPPPSPASTLTTESVASPLISHAPVFPSSPVIASTPSPTPASAASLTSAAPLPPLPSTSSSTQPRSVSEQPAPAQSVQPNSFSPPSTSTRPPPSVETLTASRPLRESQGSSSSSNRMLDMKPRKGDTSLEQLTPEPCDALQTGPTELADPQTISLNVYIRGTVLPSRCKGCGTTFEKPSFIWKKVKARFCYYTGAWYCYDCHRDEKSLIPGSVVLKWDFTQYPVSSRSEQKLAELRKLPLIDINRDNPELYRTSPELNNIRKFRARLMLIAEFCQACERSATSLRASYQSFAYLIQDIHLYSVADLDLVRRKRLGPMLQSHAQFLLDHIFHCEVCRARGFYCAKCNNLNELLFPFQTGEICCCSQCSAGYHQRCFKPASGEQCPKCEERNRLQKQRSIA